MLYFANGVSHLSSFNDMETPPEWKTCVRAGRSQPGAFMKVAVKHTRVCFAVFVRITQTLFFIARKLHFHSSHKPVEMI